MPFQLVNNKNYMQQTHSYALHTLLEKVDCLESLSNNNSKCYITCIEALQTSLFMGTSNGMVIHFFYDSEYDIYVQASTQFVNASKGCEIKSILLLPIVFRAMVLTNNSISFFSLPDFAPVTSMGRIRNVYSVCLDSNVKMSNNSNNDNTTTNNNNNNNNTNLIQNSDNDDLNQLVTVFTAKAILIVKVKQNEVRLIRNVDYPGVIAAKQHGSIVLAANKSVYDIIDINNVRKIPLFSICTSTSNDIDSKVSNSSEPTEDSTTSSKDNKDSKNETEKNVKNIEDKRDKQDNKNKQSTKDTEKDNSKKDLKKIETKDVKDTQDTKKKENSKDTKITKDTTKTDNTNIKTTKEMTDSKDTIKTNITETTNTEKLKDIGNKNTKENKKNNEISITTKDTNTKNNLKNSQGYLTPHIELVESTEYIVTNGTSISEPSMGMVVNLDGDISRGTIAWPKYPKSIAVDYPNITSIIDSSIQVHSLIDQSLTQKINLNDLQKTNQISTNNLDENFTFQYFLTTVSQPCFIPNHKLANEIMKVPLFDHRKSDNPKETEKRKAEELIFANQITLSQSSLFLVNSQSGAVYCLLSCSFITLIQDALDSISQNENTGNNESLPSFETSKGIKKALYYLNNIIENSTTEFGFVELSFARQLIGLAYFETGNYPDALHYWNNTLLDPRIIIFLFTNDKTDTIKHNDKESKVYDYAKMKSEDIIQGNPWIHSEIKNRMTEQLNSKQKIINIDLPAANAFYKAYLAMWLDKKGLESVVDSAQVFESVEIAFLCVLLNSNLSTKEELYTFIENSNIEYSITTAVHMLSCSGRYKALIKLYQASMKNEININKNRISLKEYCELLRSLILKKFVDPDLEIVECEKELVNVLINAPSYKNCTNNIDSKIIMDYGIWLVERNPEVGLDIFIKSHKECKNELQSGEVRKRIENIGGKAWRRYLEYMIFKTHSFDLFSFNEDNISTDCVDFIALSEELILLYTDEMIEEANSNKTFLDETIKSYELYHDFCELKREAKFGTTPLYYLDFLKIYCKHVNEILALNIRLKLLQLLSCDRIYYNSERVLLKLKSSIKGCDINSEDIFAMECALAYGRMGLHDNSIKIFCREVKDYDYAIYYCDKGGMARNEKNNKFIEGDKKELFKILLNEFLNISSMDDRLSYTCGILHGWEKYFDADFVLEKMPDSWSVCHISMYLAAYLRNIVSDKYNSLILRNLSREENILVSLNLSKAQDSYSTESAPSSQDNLT